MSTNWNKLAYPGLCGLLAQQPTRLSQAMHNEAYRHLGIPFAYIAFDTLGTEQALAAMRALGIRGFSLTIPHKERAMAFIDEFSGEARAIGAINTVINTGTKLRGENTDWYGAKCAFEEVGAVVRDKRALVLGAGGAARALIYALIELGAAQIGVANRTLERAQTLADDFDVNLVDCPFTDIPLSEFDIVVNTTPIGSALSSGEPTIDYSQLRSGMVVFDAVTKETELLKEARTRGALAVSGLRMLLYQAQRQFELFTEQQAPLAVMEKALLAAAI
jgi:shikimate dehydrogenase